MIALLGRHDPAGQTAAWFALGVRPTQYLTGYTDRKVLLSAAKKTEDHLAVRLVESSRGQDEYGGICGCSTVCFHCDKNSVEIKQ